MFVIVLIGYTILVIYEFIPLYKQKLWCDFWVNTALAIFSFSIAMLLSFGVKIPSPAYPIKDAITSIIGK
jgi:hypothetical protein